MDLSNLHGQMSPGGVKGLTTSSAEWPTTLLKNRCLKEKWTINHNAYIAIILLRYIGLMLVADPSFRILQRNITLEFERITMMFCI